MQYKRPESILVVIYCVVTQRFLMLQRQDDSQFWQSVTGSLEEGEKPHQTAIREVKEETGIDIIVENLSLKDGCQQVVFEIFPQFRHRYAPSIKYNTEHWFYLALPSERIIFLTEHLAYRWLGMSQAMAITKSPNNRQAIAQCQKFFK